MNDENIDEIRENGEIEVLDAGMEEGQVIDEVSACCWAPIMPVRLLP